jgi:hypothetical protein
MRPYLSTLIGAVVLALASATAGAQESGPPATTTPAPSTAGTQYTYMPLYGLSAGIAIPAGRIGDDHSAGYALGGLVEYAVTGQPYSLRAEGYFQRYPLSDGRTTGKDVNVFSIGPTVVYQLQQSATQTFLTGGIAIYNATDEGTRPGFNVGAGIGIPLTGFSALAEIRLHVMLADGKPVLGLPLTVGVRF